MCCTVCGSVRFRMSVYRWCRGFADPALECVRCGALHLFDALSREGDVPMAPLRRRHVDCAS